MAAPLAVLCAPAVAARVRRPQDLAHETLLRSYRAEDWPGWFAAAGLDCPAIRGPVFDSSRLMVEAAVQGAGVALAPPSMFERELQEGRLLRPLSIEVMTGSYWLTRLRSRPVSPAMALFRDWLLAEAGAVALERRLRPTSTLRASAGSRRGWPAADWSCGSGRPSRPR